MEFYNRNWRVPNSWNGTEDNNNKVSNYSMSFDGSTEKIEVSYNSIFSQSVYSFSFWVKNNINSGASNDGIITADSSTRGWSILQDNQTLKFNPNISGGSGQTNTSNFFNTTETWIHCVITFDGTNLIIYKNGTSVNTSTTGTRNLDANNNNLLIGYNDFSSGRFFEGQIDQVAIFDYALTDGTGGTTNQIAELYGSSSNGVGNPMAITNGRKPVAYYPLGDHSAYNGTEYLVANSALSDYVFDFNETQDISFAAANTGPLNDIGTGDFAVSIWANASSTTNYGTLIGNNTGSGLIMWRVATSNVFQCYIGSDIFTTTYIIPFDNTWHHYLITRSGTDVTLYVDGVSVLTGTSSSSLASSSISYIGNQPHNARKWKGQLSNVAIFNTALPATGTESVESLYNYGTPPDISSYSGLQGFWKLDAGSTFDGSNWTVPDESSNSNNGTSSGMTAANLVQSNLNILSPYNRYSLDFDGASNQYINFENNILQDLSNSGTIDSAITFSMWFKLGSSTTSRGMLSIGTFTNSYGKLDVRHQSSAIQIVLTNPTASVEYTYSFTDTSSWHNLVIVYDPTSASNSLVYIDGVQAGSNITDVVNLDITSQNLYVGAYYGNSDTFTGQISNVSAFNAALTSAQVTEIYNEGKPSNLNNHSAYSNLVSWWQLGENSSFNSNWTVIDEKGTNNGTSANMAENDLVNGVGTTANGLSSGMGGADNINGDAPYSTSNALSYGMGADAKSSSVPT